MRNYRKHSRQESAGYPQQHTNCRLIKGTIFMKSFILISAIPISPV